VHNVDASDNGLSGRSIPAPPRLLQQPRRKWAVHDADAGREIAQAGSSAEAEGCRAYLDIGVEGQFAQQVRHILSDTGSSAQQWRGVDGNPDRPHRDRQLSRSPVALPDDEVQVGLETVPARLPIVGNGSK
jgi:hypothetical protein